MKLVTQKSNGSRPFLAWNTQVLCVLLLGTPVLAEDAPVADPPAAREPDAPVATPGAPELGSEDERLSYALGVSAGTSYRRESLQVDPELFARGLKDAFSGGKTVLSEAEVTSIMAVFQAEMQNRRRAQQTVVLKMRAEKTKADGEAYLAGNHKREGVVTLDSGLQYKVLRAGDGAKPTLVDTVVCHYRGTLVDGTEFDSSQKRNQPATFPLKKVIKGWTEALQLMPVGSKWELVIPPHLAYGARGSGRTVPPEATLIFEVELLSIKDKSSTAAEAIENGERNGTGTGQERSTVATGQMNAVNDIKVSFKLDPRLTKGVYMGDRWVSPPSYTAVQNGESLMIEAKAEAVDETGMSLGIAPEWVPSDPGMIAVSPGPGNAVKITVQREGSSRLQVASGGVAKEFAVKAAYVGESLRAEISQN